MQLMRMGDVPKTGRDKLYRYSPSRAMSGVIIILSICAGLILFGRQKHIFLPYYIAGIFLLIVLAYQRVVIARFRPSNWLLRMTDNGLYIQFRSYLNYHFNTGDLTVVSIPYPEIRSVGLVRQVQQIPDQRHTTQTKIRRLVALELSADPAPLEQALTIERARKAPKVARWYGSSSTAYEHYPVSVVLPATVQLEWGVVPGSKIFVNDLRKYIAIAPPTSTSQKQDYAHLNKLSREEQEERILGLAEQGDIIAAIQIARELYSYDLVGAKAFVEGLIKNKVDKEGRNSEIV